MKKLLHVFLFAIFSFGLSNAQIVITEINFNTHGTDDSDYVELYNNSGSDINMANYSFSQGFEFIFPDLLFPADSYLVVTVSAESLMETFGVEGIQWTSGSLGNNEDIILVDTNGNEVDNVLYDSDGGGWPLFADGLGYAFQLCDINADNFTSENWQVTNTYLRDYGNRALYGTPGQPNNCINGPVITTSRKISRVREGATGEFGEFVFYLENSNGLSSSLNLSIDPASTATSNDYSIINTNVVFDGSVDTFAVVTIAITDDGIPEGQEKLILNIEAGDNVAKSVNDQIEIVIYDNDRLLDRSLIIVGVFDADDTDNFDDYGVELYAIKDIPDLSKYSVGMANNGGGTDGIEIPLPAISLNKRDNFFISDSKLRFENFFEVESDLAHPLSFITGDDAVELFEDGVVIDVFGDINVDGTDTPWEYANGWAKRVPDTGPDGSTFVFDNWLFTGVGFLQGPVNVACPLPYIFDFYMYTSTEEVVENNKFKLNPNLVSHTLRVNFSSGLNSEASIVISNSHGSIESNFIIPPNRESYSVDVQNLAPGLYYLSVKSIHGVETRKFMKI
jgi:hypothetical protein